MVPIFEGKVREQHKNLYFRFGTDRAIRQGKWKLVSAKQGKGELYNLENDRTELNNLADKFPEKVKKLSFEWFKNCEKKGTTEQ